MEETKINFENLTEKEAAQLMFLIRKANKEDKKNNLWKPCIGEDYYQIAADGDVEMREWDGRGYDEDSYAIGNCFKTKEEAEFEVERQKVIVELKRFAEKNNGSIGPMRYYLVGEYSKDSDNFVIDSLGTAFPIGSSIPVFSSSFFVEMAISEIG